ncbi:MAG: hypothetical protein Q4G59_06690, partial [Planctomycetia bacterium]|nr:hypothetical protein [Planctomycetia bacterium]
MGFIKKICRKNKKKSSHLNSRSLRYECLEKRELLAFTEFQLFQQLTDDTIIEAGADDKRIAQMTADKVFSWGIWANTDNVAMTDNSAVVYMTYDASKISIQGGTSDLPPTVAESQTNTNTADMKEKQYLWDPIGSAISGNWQNVQRAYLLKGVKIIANDATITEAFTTDITISGEAGAQDSVSIVLSLTVNPVGQSDISVAFPQGGDSKSLTVSQTGTAAELGTFAVTNSTNYSLDFTATKAGSGDYKSFFTVDKATSKLKLSGTAGNLEAGTYNITVTGTDATTSKTSSDVYTLTVNADPVAKSITLDPTSKTLLVSQTGINTELATVTATNIASTATFQCFVNGSTTASSDFVVNTGKLYTTKTLTAGSYSIVVKADNTASSAFALTVNADPVKSITLNPTSKTLIVSQTGANTELATVTATNIASSATFQCFVNGATTASSDFVVNTGKLYTTKTLAAGSYSIVVKADNTASSAFALTVNADPVVKSITLNPTSKTLIVSQT